MPNQAPHFGFALEYVKDIEAAKRFYERVVGLKVDPVSTPNLQAHRSTSASDTGANTVTVF